MEELRKRWKNVEEENLIKSYEHTATQQHTTLRLFWELSTRRVKKFITFKPKAEEEIFIVDVKQNKAKGTIQKKKS